MPMGPSEEVILTDNSPGSMADLLKALQEEGHIDDAETLPEQAVLLDVMAELNRANQIKKLKLLRESILQRVGMKEVGLRSILFQLMCQI